MTKNQKSQHSVSILFCIAILIIMFASSSFAQTKNDTNASPQSNQTTADENFQLNIIEKRITETNFERSTEVRLVNDNRGGLLLQVGVGVQAQKIDVLLRGIFGNVRFRASLEAIKQRIEQTLPDKK